LVNGARYRAGRTSMPASQTDSGPCGVWEALRCHEMKDKGSDYARREGNRCAPSPIGDDAKGNRH
jgi:hypothetical protein